MKNNSDSAILKIARKQLNAKIVCCKEHGVELRTHDLSNYVILKGEKLSESREKCSDCVVFVWDGTKLIVGIVELKKSTVKVNEIKDKATYTAMHAKKVLQECCYNPAHATFCFIVLAKNWRSSEHTMMRENKITFQQKKYDIIAKRGGEYMSQIIRRLL